MVVNIWVQQASYEVAGLAHIIGLISFTTHDDKDQPGGGGQWLHPTIEVTGPYAIAVTGPCKIR